MTKVKILIPGYVYKKKDQEFVSSTTTLISSEGGLTKKGVNMVVDPGMNRGLLLKALAKEKLSPDKIDYVILTHYHLDHALLTGIFAKARILDDELVYSWQGTLKEHNQKVPGTEIKILKTPGHDPFHCSVLVNTREFGKVIVAGDLFWWKDGKEQKTDKANLLQHKDPYMKDWKALLASRQKILKLADYIIPGHGKMFKIKK